jgi:hypothetical protein
LMQSWERLTVVHHHLSNIIATDCWTRKCMSMESVWKNTVYAP